MFVQQLSRVLAESPPVRLPPGVMIRHFEGAADGKRWVELMNLAFADLNPPMRQWTERDFKQRVMQSRTWSHADLFLAYRENQQLVGSVSLTFRGGLSVARPAIHLLAVHPDRRRRGIARALVASLESAVWQRGYHQVFLETHSGWHNATAFYAALGYRPHIITK